MEQSKKPQRKSGTIKRLLNLLLNSYPVLIPIVVVCIIIAAITASLPAIFQQQIYVVIGDWTETGDWEGAAKLIIPLVTTLATFYVISLIAGFAQSQLMAIITQGFLNGSRCSRKCRTCR